MNKRLLLFKRLRPALWLILLLPVMAIAETDWSEELTAIQQLQADGNVVQAVIDLEALHSQNPTAARLKLELAVLYLQLNQPDTAERYLADVLADPDLPVRVRINTQVLLIQAQEAQTVSDYQFSSYLELSAGQTEQANSGYAQVGGQGQLLLPKTVFYSTRQSYTVRPLIQMTALSRHYPGRTDSPWLGRLEGGFSVRNPNAIVQLTLGLQHDDTLDGWLGRVAFAQSMGAFRVRLAHDQFWHDQGLESDSRAALSAAVGTRSRASLFWESEHRRLDANATTTTDHDLGVGISSDFAAWETEFNLVQSLTRDQLGLENRVIWQLAPDWRLRLRVDLTDLTETDPLSYAASISLRWTP
ncbi:tetratricopeptide repeat protein [Saccharospirillum alexandrii]|uniref:tetratricopeptide repeat protein n=1 Tax=Saccharospirillum alexandrii TaxID=2448477 RepID=UPI000FDC8AF1|nr:tetratricopeptide repeat protein [Saccharospirillum alexandrii]